MYGEGKPPFCARIVLVHDPIRIPCAKSKQTLSHLSSKQKDDGTNVEEQDAYAKSQSTQTRARARESKRIKGKSHTVERTLAGAHFHVTEECWLLEDVVRAGPFGWNDPPTLVRDPDTQTVVRKKVGGRRECISVEREAETCKRLFISTAAPRNQRERKKTARQSLHCCVFSLLFFAIRFLGIQPDDSLLLPRVRPLTDSPSNSQRQVRALGTGWSPLILKGGKDKKRNKAFQNRWENVRVRVFPRSDIKLPFW